MPGFPGPSPFLADHCRWQCHLRAKVQRAGVLYCGIVKESCTKLAGTRSACRFMQWSAKMDQDHDYSDSRTVGESTRC